jgi:iron complex outermembrane receptor protein
LLTALVLVCGGLSTPLQAQPEGLTIQGQVTDPSGEPVAARVEVRLGKEQPVGTRAGAEGTYELQLSAEQLSGRDSLKVVARQFNYNKQRRFIPAQPGTQTLNFELGVLETEQVVVTGRIEQKASEVVNSLEVVDQRKIDKMATADLNTVMEQMSGYSYNEQPSIRGSSGYTYGAGSRVITLMNGRPMLEPSLSAVNFEMLPTDNIRKVEVFKGASSVLYGSGAMGGIINVIQADPTEDPKTSLRMRTVVGGAPANDTADWDGRSGFVNHSYHFYHGRKIGNFYLTTQADMIREGGHIQDNFSNKHRFLLRTRYDVPGVEGLTFRLDGQVYQEHLQQSLLWADYPDGALEPSSSFNNEIFRFRGYIDPGISYTDPDGRFRTQYKGRTYLSQDLFTGSRTVGRYNAYYNELQHTQYFSDDLSLVGGLVSNISHIGSNQDFGEATSYKSGAFAQLNWRLNRRWKFNLGARYQHELITAQRVDQAQEAADSIRGGGGGGGAINPEEAQDFDPVTMNRPIFRGGVNFRVANETYLRASVGQAVRSPSIAERFTQGRVGGLIRLTPNFNINLEEGYSAEVGAKQRFATNDGRLSGQLDLAAFMMNFTNMVEFYVATDETIELINQGQTEPVFQSQNLPDARIFGTELTSNLNYELSDEASVALNGGVTLLEPRNPNGEDAWNGDDSVRLIQQRAIELLTADDDLPENFEFPQDNPSFLKYRSRWLLRYTLDFSYKNVTLSGLYRYNSQIRNVDQLFLVPLIFPGTRKFRTQTRGGFHLLDVRLAIEMPTPAHTDMSSTLTLMVNNVLNTEHTIRPGLMGRQRNFGMQFNVSF